MSKLLAMKPRKLIRIFIRVGFYVHHQTGSHVQLRHEIKLHLRLTIPCHSRFDLPSSIIASILKQAELSREEFVLMLGSEK